MKALKKTMSLTLALIMLVGIIASTNVFAEGTFEKKVVSDLKAEKGFLKGKIEGTVDLRKTIEIEPAVKVSEETPTIYTGKIKANVEAGDLFSGAYDVYKKEFKGQKDFRGRYWENIVMFNEGSEFPTAQYTLKFPSNFKIDEKAIISTENSEAISEITAKYKKEDNSVTITIKLGNWNDYKGFFELVEKELEKSGHEINVEIPYTINAEKIVGDELGVIEGKGNCYLYKCSGFGQGRIVTVDTVDEPIIVRR